MNSFPLVAAPLFILMGNILGAARLTDRIVRFATSLVGALRGGYAHASILSSMIFAGMVGSAVADAAGHRRRRSPRHEEGGLSAGDGGGDQRCGGDDRPDHSAQPADGDLRRQRRRVDRPPVPRRRHSRRADGRVADGHGRDHRAAPGPAAPCLRRPARTCGSRSRAPRGRCWRRSSCWAACSADWFTPTEAAAVADIYALFLGFVAYRTLGVKDLPGISWSTPRRRPAS